MGWGGGGVSNELNVMKVMCLDFTLIGVLLRVILKHRWLHFLKYYHDPMCEKCVFL